MYVYTVSITTGGPKLINSDLFTEKRATTYKISFLYVYSTSFPTNKLLLTSFGAPVI